MDQWVVIMQVGERRIDTDDLIVYGPMTAEEAAGFADFAGKEIDPAEPRKLRPPIGELLAWRRAHYQSEHGRTIQ